MQFATPMVVSNIGGPPWVVGDTGVTFEPGDSSDLAIAISSLLLDPMKLTNMRRACEDRLSKFHPSRNIELVLSEYERVIN